ALVDRGLEVAVLDLVERRRLEWQSARREEWIAAGMLLRGCRCLCLVRRARARAECEECDCQNRTGAQHVGTPNWGNEKAVAGQRLRSGTACAGDQGTAGAKSAYLAAGFFSVRP